MGIIETVLRDAEGVTIVPSALNDPEKRAAFEKRMREATRKGLAADRRAAMESIRAARDKWVD